MSQNDPDEKEEKPGSYPVDCGKPEDQARIDAYVKELKAEPMTFDSKDPYPYDENWNVKNG